jgi:hypothetical protein
MDFLQAPWSHAFIQDSYFDQKNREIDADPRLHTTKHDYERLPVMPKLFGKWRGVDIEHMIHPNWIMIHEGNAIGFYRNQLTDVRLHYTQIRLHNRYFNPSLRTRITLNFASSRRLSLWVVHPQDMMLTVHSMVHN